MRRAIDRTLTIAGWSCVLFVGFVLVLLLGAIVVRGLPAIDWAFLTQPQRAGGAEGGIIDNVIGTTILIATAAVVVTPLAVGTAITHGYYLRSSKAKARLELFLVGMSGIPSILLGIFGMIVFVGLLGWGKSWLAGGVLLALVMLPTVAVAMIERIGALPKAQVEAAVGLGMDDSQVVRSVILPQSFGALITGLLLGLARVAGETAPILFTATVFAGASFPTAIRESPVMSLPYHVFVLAQDSLDPAMRDRVWGAATVLLILVLALSAVALPLRLRIHDESVHG